MAAPKIINKMRIAISLLAVVIYSLSNFAPALAAASSGVNLTTSPLPINLSADPGQTISTDLRIQNAGSTAQQIKVSLMKFSAYGESGKPALQDRQPGDDYFDWVSFSPQTFNAPPKQWISVKMTIKIPSSAAFGYYYAVVFTPTDQKPSGKGNVLLGSTAILVLLDVKSPNAKRSAQIANFSVDKKVYEFLPANFSVRLHNDGNVHLLPAGNIYIKRGSKQVAVLEFNSQHGNILPNSYRVYSASWSDGFPVYQSKVQNGRVVLDKNGKPVTELSWQFNKLTHLKFGHYTANLLAVYDNGKRDVPLEASVSFWVIPWRLLAIVFGLVGLIAGLITYVIILRRRLKRAGKIHSEHKK